MGRVINVYTLIISDAMLYMRAQYPWFVAFAAGAQELGDGLLYKVPKGLPLIHVHFVQYLTHFSARSPRTALPTLVRVFPNRQDNDRSYLSLDSSVVF